MTTLIALHNPAMGGEIEHPNVYQQSLKDHYEGVDPGFVLIHQPPVIILPGRAASRTAAGELLSWDSGSAVDIGWSLQRCHIGWLDENFGKRITDKL